MITKQTEKMGLYRLHNDDTSDTQSFSFFSPEKKKAPKLIKARWRRMVSWGLCPSHWWICRMLASPWRSPKPAKLLGRNAVWCLVVSRHWGPGGYKGQHLFMEISGLYMYNCLYIYTHSIHSDIYLQHMCLYNLF